VWWWLLMLGAQPLNHVRFGTMGPNTTQISG
jgi:hypothetical protein